MIEGGGGGKREIIYLSPHCHHLNDSRIKMRWAAMRAILMFHWLWRTKSQDSAHRRQLLKREESRSGIRLRPFCLPALLLGQTCSLGDLSIQREFLYLVYIYIIIINNRLLLYSVYGIVNLFKVKKQNYPWELPKCSIFTQNANYI